MHLLKTIPINIDSKRDGVSIQLHLFSKGDKPNWLDDFPRAIVRVVGSTFTVSSSEDSMLDVLRFYLIILKDRRIQKIYSPNQLSVTSSHQTEVAIEGKHLIDILDDHKAEVGKVMLFTNHGVVISEAFDGDQVEQQLKNLNNVDHDEYQNIYTDDFTAINELENWVPIVNVLTIEERDLSRLQREDLLI